MNLQRTMLVIRRCPFCVKDTEQNAYYAYKPELKVTAPDSSAIEFKAKRQFEWYGVAECKSCGNTYVVQGAIPIINKDITGVTKSEEVTLAYTCCDFCFNEEHSYMLANMLITLRNGMNIYMCDRHAEEIKREKGKRESYDFLITKIEGWRSSSR